MLLKVTFINTVSYWVLIMAKASLRKHGVPKFWNNEYSISTVHAKTNFNE